MPPTYAGGIKLRDSVELFSPAATEDCNRCHEYNHQVLHERPRSRREGFPAGDA